MITYLDTHAAIQAINRGEIDYYVMKSWDPPDQCLYAALDDLSAEWLHQASRFECRRRGDGRPTHPSISGIEGLEVV